MATFASVAAMAELTIMAALTNDEYPSDASAVND